MAWRTKRVVSKGMSYVRPSGKEGFRRSIVARTWSATWRALAPGSWKTATPPEGLPFFWKKTS
jgi:hypothetical protein